MTATSVHVSPRKCYEGHAKNYYPVSFFSVTKCENKREREVLPTR